jgi:hypothetical protein
VNQYVRMDLQCNKGSACKTTRLVDLRNSVLTNACYVAFEKLANNADLGFPHGFSTVLIIHRVYRRQVDGKYQCLGALRYNLQVTCGLEDHLLDGRYMQKLDQRVNVVNMGLPQSKNL